MVADVMMFTDSCSLVDGQELNKSMIRWNYLPQLLEYKRERHFISRMSNSLTIGLVRNVSMRMIHNPLLNKKLVQVYSWEKELRGLDKLHKICSLK